MINALTHGVCTLHEALVNTAQLDAELLLAHVLKMSRAELYIQNRSLSSEERQKFEILIERRKKREPLAYIIGTKEFWSIPIRVTPAVLIPRPETEHVVEEVLKLCPAEASMLDLCTGSGCIPAALAKELPKATLTITDISPEALKIARENLCFAHERITFYHGDLFSALPVAQKFDLITANPPYGRSDEFKTFAPEISFEPHSAIDGGNDGLDFIRRIIHDAPHFLKPGGWLIMEIGDGQSATLLAETSEHKAYQHISVVRDLAGIERIIKLQRS
ncbi:MAG: peptide chain release factor N(5)-glutamine methyltransferase [Deltaproteobacteria bacterium]|nr:peptide chain release factor N(5)-glutamine methyltransferase [Deltaproteobacteria bacterium]